MPRNVRVYKVKNKTNKWKWGKEEWLIHRNKSKINKENSRTCPSRWYRKCKEGSSWKKKRELIHDNRREKPTIDMEGFVMVKFEEK